MFHAAVPHGVPTSPCTVRPQRLQVPFSSPFRVALARRPWIAQSVHYGLPKFQQVPIMYASPQRPAPALRPRDFVGWFKFTFLSLALCAMLSHADIYPARRARSPALSVRRGAAPSTTIMSPSTRAPGCHPCSPVPTSPSLSISHTLPQHEARAHAPAVPGCPASARTGARALPRARGTPLTAAAPAPPAAAPPLRCTHTDAHACPPRTRAHAPGRLPSAPRRRPLPHLRPCPAPPRRAPPPPARARARAARNPPAKFSPPLARPPRPPPAAHGEPRPAVGKVHSRPTNCRSRRPALPI